MGERPVDQDTDAVLLREGKDRLFDLSAEQVVRRLKGVDGTHLLEFGHLPSVVVRDANVADEALSNEVIDRLGGDAYRRRRIRPVNLVDVDVVGSESAEARFKVATQSGRATVPDSQAVVIAKTDLSGDDK